MSESTEFQQEYRAAFCDDGRRQLDELAEHYVQITEEHDQRVCRRRNERGIAIPVDAWERHECMTFAREQEMDYEWLARRLGFSHADWLDARHRAVRQMERTGWHPHHSPPRPTRDLTDGEPCDHPGCASHVTHPCESCGRVGAQGAWRRGQWNALE